MPLTPEDNPILSVQNLHIAFNQISVVKGVNFAIYPKQTLALVGESGSGKSITAHAILRLLPANASYWGKALHHQSNDNNLANHQSPTDLLTIAAQPLRRIRGNNISMIFQEPMTSLNPLHNIEKQISEVLHLHQGLQGKQAQNRCLELLDMVEISAAKERLKSLPHELSGGQRQRVMIAMALANNPKLLIADEPTTALDVTIAQKILHLLQNLQNELGMSLLLISHDLNIVRTISHHVCVMQAGKIVEQNSTKHLFDNPKHPYTQKLLAAEPCGKPAPYQSKASEIIKVDNLKVWFNQPQRFDFLTAKKPLIKAVDDISFSIQAGKTLGIVGESGSGKSTLGLAILRLINSSGKITFNQENIHHFNDKKLRPIRKQLQVVFQDPFGSLSPRLAIGQIVGEGLDIHQIGSKDQRKKLVREALTEVGIDPDTYARYPHEFSGGQRQRIAIARALVLKPKLIILDEPTSALDRTVQSQIVDLLRNLQIKHQLTYIFISHDLAVIKALSHDLLVIQNGKIIESGAANKLFDCPQHPYTKQLLQASFYH